jgi:hypothetical protein
MALVLGLGLAACSPADALAPHGHDAAGAPLAALVIGEVHTSASPSSCWGQATQVFARMGVMGQHASQQETPRIGLRNLARALYDQGILRDDSLQALGAFVAEELGLTIEACL